jgi:hypothetical protein
MDSLLIVVLPLLFFGPPLVWGASRLRGRLAAAPAEERAEGTGG